jgi:sterol desaturase/sphingolipid hydroxylase (fatty acid hydroxylase superfamily)
MFISLKSLKNFIVINSSLIITSLVQHFFVSNDIIPQYISNLTKNYLLINMIEYSIENKNKISDLNNPIVINQAHQNILSSTIIETLTCYVIKNYFVNQSDTINILLFIPKTFLFEFIFDIFHYCAHRLEHQNKFLYQNFHKKHHNYNNINSYVTFCQSPIDLILSNSLPQIATLFIMPKFSSLEYTLIKMYLSYGEIGGHNGHYTYPTSSFSQFIWLPKFLNIELYSEDHYLHHSLNNCNYGKRFSFCDKLFGTYSSIVYKYKNGV